MVRVWAVSLAFEKTTIWITAQGWGMSGQVLTGIHRWRVVLHDLHVGYSACDWVMPLI